MSSALISAEITATCNALGDANKSTKYILGPHCKESAKDLIKYLRRDDETHSIRRQLGDTNVVHTDLIPIIIHFSDNEELFDIILRLLVNLTTPAMILYNEEIPGDKVVRQLYHQIISHLQKYKIAFANEALWKILRTQLTSILNIPRAERTEEKNLVAERIIILIRNVLQIPTDPETERCCHDNPNSHDTVVYVLNQAGMLDILIYIAMSPDESNYYLHLLEIMMLLLKEQNPESLAKSDRTRTTTEKQKDENELNRIREREVKEKAERLMKYSSRHSRFGGTYVVKGVKGIGDKDVLRPTKTPKNRAPLKDNRLEHRSPLSVRIILRGFCEEFLQAYNNVMRGVRESISRDKAQANDETYYFWAVGFFMAFNRHVGLQIELISETMAVNIFHFLQTQIDTWLSNMAIEKKKITLWSRRVHIALKAYKEMVLTLLSMISSDDEGVRRSAATIQSNIFYILEYRELVLVLFYAYQETKFSREYLKDLLETTHVFLKMLEHSCKHKKLVVQKHGRMRKAKSTKSTGKQFKRAAAAAAAAADGFTDETWNDISPQISAIIQHPELSLPSTVPFDAASDLPIDEQR
ncbi:hypothetical protein M8J75_015950 [Diaphorina citri]|nr:hypothetical protein M8J75_015950 [Diaphorina citri]